MEKQLLDLVVTGAGPAGICCGLEAQNAGLDYLVLDKGVLVNSIYHFPTNMTFFSTSLKLEIGGVPFISHADKPTRKEALEYYRRIVESRNLRVQLYEEVLGVMPDRSNGDGLRYRVQTTKGEYLTRAVVVSTGYYDTPRKLNVPGEDLPKVKHYYDDAHPYIGQKVLVIGAANSACDVALETWQKGAEVTMAVRENQLYQKVKYWILPNIENRIKEGSIRAFFDTTVREIREKSVVLNTPEGEKIIENDFVLAMTGYQPNYAFFEKIGLQIENGPDRLPVLNPDTFESSMENVYLAGVVQSGLQTSKLFIENTRHHGAIIVKDLCRKLSRTPREV
ncbi:MAG: YpdA family putative bacillithiol disulfide reductase [Bacteroidetes bacterium]|nr:MAG: YpdA family putative bacillithiol disulfide reductase [Bacteroidota bacterium]